MRWDVTGGGRAQLPEMPRLPKIAEIEKREPTPRASVLYRGRLSREEGLRLFQEQIELIMMHPVARLWHFDEPAMLHGAHARIVFRHRSKAFQSPEEQRGRGDLAVN